MKKLILIFLVIIGLSRCNQTKTESKTENAIILLTGSWVQPNPINEKEVQGFTLQQDGKAISINMATLIYKKWWTEESKLVLVAESIGNHSSSIDTSRYEIVKNTNSILELKNGDFVDKYTKK